MARIRKIKPDDEKRTKLVGTRVQPEEFVAIEAIAKKERRSVSSMVREFLLEGLEARGFSKFGGARE